MRRVLVAAAIAGILGAVPAMARAANYGAPDELSATGGQEFNFASSPTYAAGGAFVAFRGALGGQPGIYRRDQRSGALALVAPGDAAAPSISADGRYVAFTSTANLDPVDEPAADAGCPEVFVRDMAVALGSPGAFTLVAARDGRTTGLTYTGCPGAFANPPSDGSGSWPTTGAAAAAGAAISADGRSVAFTVLGPSDLGRAAGDPSTAASADASQVAVRNLDTHATTVVSATPSGQPTPGGGAYPSVASETRGTPVRPISENNDFPGSAPLPLSTASISGDGTTVAWLGTNVPSQVPGASDVTSHMPGPNGPALEVEPLWRRVADGPGAVTKRLLASAGLDFYDTLRATETGLPIQGGSVVAVGSPIGPVLNADGTAVAVMSNALTPQQEAAIQAATSGSTNVRFPNDAYIVHVDDGPSAPQATRLSITDYFDSQEDVSLYDVALSSSGRYLAFDTSRAQFTLPTPTLITPPSLTTTVPQTYVVDLARGTLELVSSTFDASAPNGSSLTLSLDAAGDLAVSSRATNLVYGDQNPAQVFEYPYLPLPGSVAAGGVSPLPAGSGPRPAIAPWVIGVRSRARRDGSASVQVTVPGRGRIDARAAAQLPPRTPTGTRRPRGADAGVAADTTTHRRKKKKRKTDTGVPVPSRTVAVAGRRVNGPRSVTVRLRVMPRFRTLVRSGHGLYAVVTVRFTAAGHATIVQQVPVTFHRVTPAPRHRRRHHRPSPAR